MNNSISELKPKANKLLGFVTNWQLAKPSVNTELGAAIQSVITKGSFPTPIKKFLQLPQFKELLSNLEKGKLYVKKDESVSEEQDIEFHPPIEIQNIQILVEAFHQLVHLDYNRLKIKDPIVQVKVLGQNVLSYLSCIDLFIDYEGKVIDEILAYLFNSVRIFAEKMQKIVSNHRTLFTTRLYQLSQQKNFLILKELNRLQYNNNIIQEWLPVLVELNIDPKLERTVEDLSSIAIANAHKLINRIQSLFSEKRQFYQRNLPLYRPFDVKIQIFESLSKLKKKDRLLGQTVNEMFYAQFWKEKYAIIHAKQAGTNKKYLSLASQLWPVKESIVTLIQQYHFVLPQKFSNYFLQIFQSTDFFNQVFGKPNVHAVQLALGFFNTQYDFLAELLSNPPRPENPVTIQSKIYALFPAFISFLEAYYLMNPKPSFVAIKHKLENLFPGEEALKEYTLKEVLQKVEAAFELLLPKTECDSEKIESALFKIISELRGIHKELTPNSIEANLLEGRIRSLESFDLPSYEDGWHILGEILGVFFLLLSELEESFSEKIKQSEVFLKKYPFFEMLFYQI